MLYGERFSQTVFGNFPEKLIPKRWQLHKCLFCQRLGKWCADGRNALAQNTGDLYYPMSD